MDGLLLKQSRMESASGNWLELVRELRSEVAQLRDEVKSLHGENLEWRPQVGYWKSMPARALERITVLEQENEHGRGENRRLQEQLFGQKSEKRSRNDRSNDRDGLDDEDQTDPSPPDGSQAGPKKKQQGPKRRAFRHLPAQEQCVELPKDERICPTCRKPLVDMTDTEDSEQIEIDVQAHRRVLRRRR
jgi:hypothetical protein